MSRHRHPYQGDMVSSPQLDQAVGQLTYLRSHESRQAFRHDLREANAALHMNGLLPGLDIVSTRHGLRLAHAAMESPYARGYGQGGYDGGQGYGNYYRQGRQPSGRGYYDNPGGYGTEYGNSQDAPPYYGGRGQRYTDMRRAQDQGSGPLQGLFGSIFGGHQFGGQQSYDNGSYYPQDQHHWRAGGLNYGGLTYNGARGVSPELAHQNAKIVAEVADQKGIPRDLAVATMLVESHGNHQAHGDNYASIGLYQLNKYGEGKGMTYAQKIDPWTNASVALSEFQRRKGWYSDPGVWAAESQRPKYRHKYANAVKAMLPIARQLLET